MLIIVFILVYLIFSYLSSIIKKGFGIKDLLKGVGSLSLILIIMVFNEFYMNSASFWFTQKMSNKYSYLEKSEKLIKKGKLKEAFSYSQNAYDKYLKESLSSQFFILSRLYSKTSVNQEIQLTKKYGSIVNLANCKEIISGNLSAAEELYKEALHLTKSENLLSNKPEYLVLPLSALAYIKLSEGDYEESERLFYRLEQISNNLSTKDLAYKINGILVFINSSIRSGDLVKADYLLDEVFDLYKNNELKKGSIYKSFLLIKIRVALSLNKFKSAKDFYLELSELEISDENIMYPVFLSTKAALYVHAYYIGLNYDDIESESFFNSAFSLFGRKNEINLLKEAEKFLIEKIRILEDSQGEESLFFLEAIRELANFYRDNGNHEKADKLYNSLIHNINFDKDKLQDTYSDLLIDVISINRDVDISIVKKAEALIFKKAAVQLLYLTERDKETYVSKIENQINVINNYYLINDIPESAINLYNNVLRFKEVALNSNRNIRTYLKNLPDSTVVEYRKLLSSLRNLENEKNNFLIEKKIVNILSSNNDFSKNLDKNNDFRLIQNCLDSNEYAVEIINTPFIDKTGKLSYKYFALIINSEVDVPIKIELFDKEDLDSILNVEGNAEVRYNNLYNVNLHNSELKDLIWKPIETIIDSSSKVFISLSGDLNKVALPSLFVGLSNEIHLVGSTKNIVDLNHGYYNNLKPNIAFGGANFNSIINIENTRSLSSIKNNIIAKIEKGIYKELPYTLKEVEEIKSVLSKENQNCSVLIENEASEINFRNIDGREYNFVHIATHGFYYPAEEIELNKKNAFNFNLDDSMGRSGILLSQNIDFESSYKNDGIVTAREISAMDLSNIDLIVLSACDTGIGDYRGSEGVFGLQRALKLSGVKKQIVSLWKVPDRETSELFTLFYKHYVTGWSAYQSLKKAQIAMSSKYDAFYWAGFVLIE
jgi:CHAT domain-containing protein